jgi:hypothetical protein
MKHPKIQAQISGKKGFAMLFAVLTSSVLLSIGLSIFNLTVKELILSSSGRESQFAFYASDTGIECAIYWDFNGANIFGTSTDHASRNPSPANPDCVDTFGQAAQAIDITTDSSTISSGTTQFGITIPNVDAGGSSAPYCAVVTVYKALNGSIIETTIDSRGYNTCDTGDVNRVERAIRVKY